MSNTQRTNTRNHDLKTTLKSLDEMKSRQNEQNQQFLTLNYGQPDEEKSSSIDEIEA